MKTDMKNPEYWIPKHIFLSYCGDKTDKAEKFYDRAVEKKRMNLLNLNWLGIILLPAWLSYRRQWGIYMFITGIIILSSFVEAIFDITIPNQTFVGGTMAIGAMGYSLLLQNANAKYQKLKNKGMNEIEINQAIENMAKPSIKLAILGTIGCFALIIIFTIVADLMFGLPE